MSYIYFDPLIQLCFELKVTSLLYEYTLNSDKIKQELIPRYEGFPDIQNPVEELLAITVKNQSNKQIITWGTGDFKTDRTDVTYIKCRNEKSLIMEFMKFWMKNYPDVITGWNTKFFDLPYLKHSVMKKDDICNF